MVRSGNVHILSTKGTGTEHFEFRIELSRTCGIKPFSLTGGFTSESIGLGKRDRSNELTLVEFVRVVHLLIPIVSKSSKDKRVLGKMRTDDFTLSDGRSESVLGLVFSFSSSSSTSSSSSASSAKQNQLIYLSTVSLT